MPQRFVLIPLDIYQSLVTTPNNLSLQALTNQREQLLTKVRNPYVTQKLINATQKQINMARQNEAVPKTVKRTHEASTQTLEESCASNTPLHSSMDALSFDNFTDDDPTPQDMLADTQPPRDSPEVSSNQEEQNNPDAEPLVIRDFFTNDTIRKKASKVYQAFMQSATLTGPNKYKLSGMVYTPTELRDIINYAISSTAGTDQPVKWNYAWPAIICNSFGQSHFAKHLRTEMQYGNGMRLSAKPAGAHKKLKLLSLPH